MIRHDALSRYKSRAIFDMNNSLLKSARRRIATLEAEVEQLRKELQRIRDWTPTETATAPMIAREVLLRIETATKDFGGKR